MMLTVRLALTMFPKNADTLKVRARFLDPLLYFF